MSNKLQVVQQQLVAAKTIKDMVSLPVVENRFIANYEKTTGKKDGKLRFQQEVFNFLEIANENKKIFECDRFSIFAAVVKAGTTGLSFRDGHLYPIVYGNVLKTTIGAHGKREMLMRMPNVKFVDEAQVVMKNDEFIYDKLNSKVSIHNSDINKQPPMTLENILAAYFRIHFVDGTVKDVMMTNAELVKARAAAKTMKVWDNWTGQMCKKSVYNRGFVLYHRYPEGEFPEMQQFDGSEEDEFIDAPVVVEEVKQEQQPAKTNIPDDVEDAKVEEVDEDTGEVTTKKEEEPPIQGAF